MRPSAGNYDRGFYNTGCFDGVDTEPGRESLTDTGALRFTVTGAPALARTIVYDYCNRVTSITENGQASTFNYNPSGKRVIKVEGDSTTRYFFANYELETNGTTETQICYYFVNGQQIAQRKIVSQNGSQVSDTLLYINKDHLGSAVRLTNANGNVVQSLAYDPFGLTVYSVGVNEPTNQYTGQKKDSSGLYYYGARYYDPELGRFTSPDSYLDGLNRYAYCGNNPINYVDPTGNDFSSYGEAFNYSYSFYSSVTGLSGDSSSGGGGPSGGGVVYDFKANTYDPNRDCYFFKSGAQVSYLTALAAVSGTDESSITPHIFGTPGKNSSDDGSGPGSDGNPTKPTDRPPDPGNIIISDGVYWGGRIDRNVQDATTANGILDFINNNPVVIGFIFALQPQLIIIGMIGLCQFNAYPHDGVIEDDAEKQVQEQVEDATTLQQPNQPDPNDNDKNKKFDPSKKQDQRDEEWHYHWDEQAHDSRGSAAHWDRGNLTTGAQEWSTDGINWFPK